MKRIHPAVVLFFLSPILGEVLFGALPLSKAIPGLLSLIGLYGGGALMIRELVRIRRLGVWSLFLLGLAYGIVEEGVVVQSFLNPHYPGLDFLGEYGRSFGISWVWAVFIVVYHAVFSVTIPIVLTECIFPEKRDEPWLGKKGWFFVASIFLGTCAWLLIFVTKVGYNSYIPPAAGTLIGTFLMAVIFVKASLLVGTKPNLDSDSKNRFLPSTRTVRITTFALTMAWFVVRIILTDPAIPAFISLLGDLIVLTCGFTIIFKWDTERWDWKRRQAAAAGALPANWLFGFLIVAATSPIPVLDLPAHLLIGLICLMGLHKIKRELMKLGT
ncbi:hypothetical protein GK047_28900 [Paenibacillus sp. SYP-B3998]|uniref:Uncharacterized protein n=1 Tax=Paenibacillus sp. SYP-B3998 TaxID=2678564 RepID=A0A6G4A8F7_9BACL|nr:hypothetical protein [Paenibacillus sp. SYP-B3998]NEW09907.1 hypothetical protein [Paenibacillus sp. SYP-B3998]